MRSSEKLCDQKKGIEKDRETVNNGWREEWKEKM